MWEVGKPWPDCLKEFDRTIEYIEATAEALRQIETGRCRTGPGGRLRRAHPPRAARRRALPRPLQLRGQRGLHHGHPRARDGQPGGDEDAALRRARERAARPRAAESFPPGVVNLVTGQGPTVVGPMMESGLVDVLALIGSARTAERAAEAAPAPVSPAHAPRHGGQEPRDRPRRRRPRRRGRRDRLGRPQLQRPALHGAQARARRARGGRRPRRAAGRPRRAAEARHAVGGEGHDHAAARSREARPPRRAWWRTRVAQGARVVNPGGGEWAGTLFRPALVYPVPEAAQLFRVEQFGPILPVSVVDSPEEALDVDRAVGRRPAGLDLRPRPGHDRQARRPPGEPRLPRQPQHPVPPRPRRLPVRRAQGLGGGHALGHRRAARLLDPQHGGRDRRASGRSSRHSGHTRCSWHPRPIERSSAQAGSGVTSTPKRRPSAPRYCSSVRWCVKRSAGRREPGVACRDYRRRQTLRQIEMSLPTAVARVRIKCLPPRFP